MSEIDYTVGDMITPREYDERVPARECLGFIKGLNGEEKVIIRYLGDPGREDEVGVVIASLFKKWAKREIQVGDDVVMIDWPESRTNRRVIAVREDRYGIKHLLIDALTCDGTHYATSGPAERYVLKGNS